MISKREESSWVSPVEPLPSPVHEAARGVGQDGVAAAGEPGVRVVPLLGARRRRSCAPPSRCGRPSSSRASSRRAGSRPSASCWRPGSGSVRSASSAMSPPDLPGTAAAAAESLSGWPGPAVGGRHGDRARRRRGWVAAAAGGGRAVVAEACTGAVARWRCRRRRVALRAVAFSWSMLASALPAQRERQRARADEHCTGAHPSRAPCPPPRMRGLRLSRGLRRDLPPRSTARRRRPRARSAGPAPGRGRTPRRAPRRSPPSTSSARTAFVVERGDLVKSSGSSFDRSSAQPVAP